MGTTTLAFALKGVSIVLVLCATWRRPHHCPARRQHRRRRVRWFLLGSHGGKLMAVLVVLATQPITN
jgi:hypothetical protein